MQIRREPTSECVPAVPFGKHSIALVLVISVSIVLCLWFAANAAHVEGWQNHSLQKIVGVQRLAYFIGEDRASNRIALAGPMGCQSSRELSNDWNSSLTLAAFGLGCNAVPNGSRNEQFTITVILPEHAAKFATTRACECSCCNQSKDDKLTQP